MGGASKGTDWVGDYRVYSMAWGIPTLILIGSLFLSHPVNAILWAAALTWMGVACLVNTRRCGRRHCLLTGPFFLLMAMVGLLHGFNVIWLGNNGWMYLAVSLVVIGWGALWYLPERIWGKYRAVD